MRNAAGVAGDIMQDSDITALSGWLAEQGLAGASEPDLISGFCHGCREAGLDLSRAIAIVDTLHPVFEGRAFPWRGDGVPHEPMVEYGRTNEGEAAVNWQQSSFHHMLTHDESEIRRRIGLGDPCDFPQFESFRDEGHTDYLGLVHRFAAQGRIGEMDCVLSHWMTRHEEGFSDGNILALRRLVPLLALAIKSASLARIASTLVDVYLGRDAGQRVLSGRIMRGTAEKIRAVLWFSDLRGYTAITDKAPPEEIIPLLNDYAEAAISSITECGGDVLKLIGDGILAIFTTEDRAEACRGALKAEAKMRKRLAILNARRADEGRPVTDVYLGLHIGDVLYGNIGSETRLDFTVVGPAVNEVNRIASLCRSVDRTLLMSADLVNAAPPEKRGHIVSVGRYALRGVRKAQELFTIDENR